MARRLTDTEKDAHIRMKELIKRPTKLKASDFKPGNMILFTYNAKYKDNPYDASPMILTLGRSRKYSLGLNLNWTPLIYRKKIIDFIMSKNRKNIKKGYPLEMSYKMVKTIIKGLGPVIRLYLNNRISTKGVIVPQTEFYKIINTRSESFIGISADEAWKMAKSGKFKRKRKKGKK